MREEKTSLTARKGIAIFFHSISVIVLAFCILLIGACGAFFSYNSVEYYFENKPYEESPLLGNQLISDLLLACQFQDGVAALYDDDGNVKETEKYGYIYLTEEKRAFPITLKDILIVSFYMDRFSSSMDYASDTDSSEYDVIRYSDSPIEDWIYSQTEEGIPKDTEFLQWFSELWEQKSISSFRSFLYNTEIFVLKENGENVGEDGKVDISNIESTTNLGGYLDRQMDLVQEKLQRTYEASGLSVENTNFRYTIVSNEEGTKRTGNCSQVENPLFTIKISRYGDEVLQNSLDNVISNQDLLNQLSGYEIYDGEFTVEAGLSETYEVWDKYKFGQELYQVFQAFLPLILISTIISVLVWLATFIMLICMAGHKDRGKEISLCFLDKWYLEILTAVGIGAFGLVMMLMDAWSSSGMTYWSSVVWEIAGISMVIVMLYVLIMVYLFSLIRRGKAGVLWKNTFLASVIRWFKRMGREFSEMITGRKKNARKIVWYYGLFFLLNAALLWMLAAVWSAFRRYGSLPELLLCLVMFCGFLWLQRQVIKFLVQKNRQMEELSLGVEEIRNGNLSYQVEADDFYAQEKKMADGINHIGEGLHAAVDTAMKSERMKTDLITNVSHDIKTPLTSIINYVDLLKREEIPNEKVQNYLDILDRKSQRLKNLTEDLVEASKASSGNMKLEMMRLDFIELVNQVNGEFQERLEGRNLTIVANIPEGPVSIMADGRRLWRVLENLYGNVAKYAMERTRVYIDVVKTEKTVSFSMKNISDAPLNISPDELTERFTRGDASRTTEGSGLGLSIAKSLTELQGGSFEIYLDGDLFRATVAFPLAAIPTGEDAEGEGIGKGEKDAAKGLRESGSKAVSGNEERRAGMFQSFFTRVGDLFAQMRNFCKDLGGKTVKKIQSLWKNGER